MSKARIKTIVFEDGGKEFTGTLVSEAEMRAANVAGPCVFGQTACVNHELWRCMEFPYPPNTYFWVNTGQPC